MLKMKLIFGVGALLALTTMINVDGQERRKKPAPAPASQAAAPYMAGEVKVTIRGEENPVIKLAMAASGVTVVEFPAADKFFAVHPPRNGDWVEVEKSPSMKSDDHLVLRAGKDLVNTQGPAASISVQMRSGLIVTLWIYPVKFISQQTYRCVVSYNRDEIVAARRRAGLAVNLGDGEPEESKTPPNQVVAVNLPTPIQKLSLPPLSPPIPAPISNSAAAVPRASARPAIPESPKETKTLNAPRPTPAPTPTPTPAPTPTPVPSPSSNSASAALRASAWQAIPEAPKVSRTLSAPSPAPTPTRAPAPTPTQGSNIASAAPRASARPIPEPPKGSQTLSAPAPAPSSSANSAPRTSARLLIPDTLKESHPEETPAPTLRGLLNVVTDDPKRFFKHWSKDNNGLSVATQMRDLDERTRVVLVAVKNVELDSAIRLLSDHPQLVIQTLDDKGKIIQFESVKKLRTESTTTNNIIPAKATVYFAIALAPPILGKQQKLTVTVGQMNAADQPAMADLSTGKK